ncbi:hypothetical protein FB567DRAFT_459422 [Paraphoma chrysanthemicola]|uniref:KOW domain-containing protein n=1 Tax=Paraphoma chrysanthemicola TaxID=798071 RepID=A0A8K0W4D5_9PLEO|nr:hypothetical protein FB567DRAFT_459422 [Paraphoma chrysanthemicola]
MSQLVVQPGRNAARQAKKLKEIRKVKGAIVWHERERKKKQEIFQERWDSKQAVIQRIKWENENVKGVRKTALANAKEDWQLGPLRPNRAIGDNAKKYGALTATQVQKPDIPIQTQRNRNEARLKRGLDPEYPLVVEDQKYFHIVPEDRVVVTEGPEKGKIGVVQDVVERTHEVIIKGINMHNYDSDIFGTTSEDLGPKRMSEVPIPIANIRLVTPYEFKEYSRAGVLVTKTQDVIVDKVLMERHTTGVDPFTGTNYGSAEIPKDHQYDPVSGLPIFHRYIAGTRQRIEWPWEKEEAIDEAGVSGKEKEPKPTLLRRTLNTLRHPIKSMQRASAKKATEPKKTNEMDEGLTEEAITAYKNELQANQIRQPAIPRSRDPKHAEAYDTDTTRNIVEGSESMAYTLVAPPFPDTLAEELRGDIQGFSAEARKNQDGAEPRTVRAKRVTSHSLAVSQEAKARAAAAQKMKTPMQLRWETEQAKKIKQQKTAPLVSTDELMAALGRHIQSQKAQSVKVSEVD